MKMELSVRERLTLSAVIPKQGDIVTYRLILGLREAIGFSESELIRWMPTLCYDISQGCPRCKGTEWETIPFALIQKCRACDFLAGIGEPGGMVWRTLDEEGQPISETAELEFGEAGLGLIIDTLNLFNTNSELDDDTAPLYVKFVEKNGRKGATEGAES